jgi:hypothetical protein
MTRINLLYAPQTEAFAQLIVAHFAAVNSFVTVNPLNASTPADVLSALRHSISNVTFVIAPPPFVDALPRGLPHDFLIVSTNPFDVALISRPC